MNEFVLQFIKTDSQASAQKPNNLFPLEDSVQIYWKDRQKVYKWRKLWNSW